MHPPHIFLSLPDGAEHTLKRNFIDPYGIRSFISSKLGVDVRPAFYFTHAGIYI